MQISIVKQMQGMITFLYFRTDCDRKRGKFLNYLELKFNLKNVDWILIT